MAFERLEVPERFVGDVLDSLAPIKKRASKEAVRSLIGFTKGDDPIFKKGQVERYGQAVGQQAAEDILAQRIAGELNDNRSIKRGLVALLNWEGALNIREHFGHPFTPEAEPFEIPGFSVHPVPDTGDFPGRHCLYTLAAPDSTYKFDPNSGFSGTMKFKGKGEEAHILLRGDDVITVVGEGGAYWQNATYTPDGSEK